MTAKRIILLVLGAALVWFVFFRKPKVVKPTATVPKTPKEAVQQTTASVIASATPGLVAITGQLVNGVAHSVGQYGQGGVNGADTGSTQQWGAITYDDSSGYLDSSNWGETDITAGDSGYLDSSSYG